MSAAVIAACGGDDGGLPVDARPIDAPSCTPVDDGNECTTDECVNDQPVHTPRDGEACAGGGTCNSSGTCVVPSCTDNMMNGTETGVDCGGSCAPARTCDTGAGCTVAGDCTSGVCSGTPMTCQAPSCGDGVMQAGEMCDDGNQTNGDGCDDGAGGTCRPTGCGNGVTTGTEACDDGNAMNGDGCDNNCTVTGCGNGVTTGTETCDDGDTMDGDGCSAACAPEAGYTCTAAVPSVCTGTCGDGVIAVGAETCDQGNNNQTPGDGCSAACAVEAGWACTGAVSTCAPVCGDGMLIAPEVCDDGNTTNLDGCSATCRNELSEVEPNEDGTPSTGGSGTTGNDFDTATAPAVSVAATNAEAQGVVLVSNGAVNLRGALRVGAAPGTAGDEDVWAIRNDTAGPVTVRLDVWSVAAGFGVPCADAQGFDTGVQIRNAQGTSLASNDDRSSAADRCSGLAFNLLPGATIYAHLVEFGDNLVLDGYGIQLAYTPIVCGDGVRAAGIEQCDDGDTVPGDGCSATCTQEAGYTCNTASPTVCMLNPFQSIPLACTDMTGATALPTPPDTDEGVSANTALPFTVPLYGSNMVSFSASANGVMQLYTTASGTSTATFSNPSTVPSTSSPNGWLAPFWDDLDVATVTTLTTGTAPNRVFTVQWSAEIFLVSGSNLQFQVQFVEGGPIEFHYCSATGDAARTTGSSATIGVENAAGTTGFAVGINTANTVTPGTTALRWTIP